MTFFVWFRLPYLVHVPTLKFYPLPYTFSLQILKFHTRDKFQQGIGEIFLSFQGGFSKMYRIYRKILNSDEGDFEVLVKSGMF